MRQRLLNIEVHHILAASTLLDPCFTKAAFADMRAAEHCLRCLTGEMAGEMAGEMGEASEITGEELNAAGSESRETEQGL